jgi:hypothetical protein
VDETRRTADEGRPADADGVPEAEGRDRAPRQNDPAAVVEGADLLEHDDRRRATDRGLDLVHRREPTRRGYILAAHGIILSNSSALGYSLSAP